MTPFYLWDSLGLLKQKRDIIMEPVKATKGDRLIEKIYMVFTLAKAGRDEAAATVLQQVFDELREIK